MGRPGFDPTDPDSLGFADPPVANPPAPDVEAKADYPSIWLEPACDGCSERTWCSEDAWGKCDECGRLPTRYVRADLHEGALTAHTASLQARVEELERQVQSAEGVISTFQHANNLYREAMDERTTFKNQARAAEAEANRMREAGERLRDALGSSFHVLHLAACEMVAALRPADEPVTQDDDLPSIQDVRGILRSDR